MRLTVAERVERLDGPVAGEESAGFLDEAGGEHLGAALIQPLIERGAGRVEADAQQAEAGEGIAGQHLRHGLARGEADLDGADELGRVVGVDARGRCGIEAGEQAMQPGAAVALGAAAKALAQVFLASGAGEEAFSERAQVEAGAAGDDGEVAAAGDFAQGGSGEAAVVAGGEGLVGIGDVDEVMRDAGAFFGRGFGGAEVHAAIDGDGVAADDFAVEALGEGEREGGFAAAGGAEKKDGERVAFVSHRDTPGRAALFRVEALVRLRMAAKQRFALREGVMGATSREGRSIWGWCGRATR